MIIQLTNQESISQFETKILNKLIHNEFRKYQLQESLQESIQKLNERNRSLAKTFREKQQTTRKQRAHQLIKIGELTELTQFTKDRGIITGVFLHMKKLFEEDPNLQSLLKMEGDQFLSEKGIENKKRYSNTTH